MTAVVVFVLLCAGAIAFMIWFFLGLCSEQKKTKCYVVHILPQQFEPASCDDTPGQYVTFRWRYTFRLAPPTRVGADDRN